MFKRELNDILTDSEIDLKVIHLYDGRGKMGDSPMYGFFIFLHNTNTRIGEVSFRFVNTNRVENYDGNIGYGVEKSYRGNHYAEKACRILRELALEHGLKQLYFTCAPDNTASVKTCQRLGAMDLGLINLPDEFRELEEIPEKRYRRFAWSIERTDQVGSQKV